MSLKFLKKFAWFSTETHSSTACKALMTLPSQLLKLLGYLLTAIQGRKHLQQVILRPWLSRLVLRLPKQPHPLTASCRPNHHQPPGHCLQMQASIHLIVARRRPTYRRDQTGPQPSARNPLASRHLGLARRELACSLRTGPHCPPYPEAVVAHAESTRGGGHNQAYGRGLLVGGARVQFCHRGRHAAVSDADHRA